MITVQELKTLLHYNPDTGVFTWLVNRPNGIKRGDVANGTITVDGYSKIRLMGRRYLAHRLAWLYVTGDWPKNQIDHINTVPLDNRITNLRDVSGAVNKQNIRKAQANNKTGLLGVSPNHSGFVANIYVNRKRHGLGTYKTKELAYAAYLDAKRRLHGINLELCSLSDTKGYPL